MKNNATKEQMIFNLIVWLIGIIYCIYAILSKNYYYFGIGLIIIFEGYIYAEQFNTNI